MKIMKDVPFRNDQMLQKAIRPAPDWGIGVSHSLDKNMLKKYPKYVTSFGELF